MKDKLNIDHVLQGSYFHKTLRQWHSTKTLVNASSFIFPLFIHENDDVVEEIGSLPGIKRLSKLKKNEILCCYFDNNKSNNNY